MNVHANRVSLIQSTKKGGTRFTTTVGASPIAGKSMQCPTLVCEEVKHRIYKRLLVMMQLCLQYHTNLPGPQERAVAVNLSHDKVGISLTGCNAVKASFGVAGQEKGPLGIC